MRYRDLGTLEGPVLLFGGPYSNVQALIALRKEAEARHIPAARMICTGDVVAYCGAPARTVTQIRQLGCPVLAGNCEIQLGQGALDCGCGFEEGSACDLLSIGWFSHASAALPAADKAWMAGLPDVLTFAHHGSRYAVIHGGVTDVARFIWPVTDDAAFTEEWAAVERLVGPVDHVIAGHSGIPFLKDLPQGRWINAGVIGMPPHDGRQTTCFAQLERGEVTFHALSYDVAGAQEDMRAAGLTPAYREALGSGYWPSEDVLPPELRRPSRASG